MILFQNLLLLSIAHAFSYLPESKGPHPNTDQKNKNEARINLVPYHALVFYSRWFCSGTIIGSRTILTTASCLTELDARIVVKIGVESILEDGQSIPVIEAKRHEFFEHLGQLDNDIALLLLERHVVFSQNVKKILIPDLDAALAPDSSVSVTGWGPSPEKLQHQIKQLIRTSFLVRNKEDCKNEFRLTVTPSLFCARYQEAKRLSDNGGPAVYDNRYLVGILSYTAPETSMYAVFTNVSYFNKWIKINTVRFLRKHCKIDQDADTQYVEYVYENT